MEYNQEYKQYNQEFDQEYNQFNQLQHQQTAGVLETSDERSMGMFLHLSPLASMVIPLAGLILPIVLWQTKKNEMPALDVHGKEVINWIITSFLVTISLVILMVVGVLFAAVLEFPPLMFLTIFLGVILILGISIANIFYAIYGGIRANSGEHWKYPFNIKFFK